jgi:hypothetical protein
MRFRSPTAFTSRAALPGAAGIRAIPLRRCSIRPAVEPGRPLRRPKEVRRTRPTGPVAGRVFRPGGCPPAPASRGPTSGLDGRRLAAPHSRGCRLDRVMHRRSLLRPVFRYPARAIARPGRGPCCRGPGGARGVRPFAVLLPPAGVGTSPPLGPTCRFPGVPSDSRRMLRIAPAGHVPSHPLRTEGVHAGRGRWPRLLGFVPAGGRTYRDRAPRRARVRSRRQTALGFFSLRSSDAGVGTASASLPLVGFADVPERDATGGSAPPRRCPCGRRRAKWP